MAKLVIMIVLIVGTSHFALEREIRLAAVQIWTDCDSEKSADENAGQERTASY